MRPVAGWLLPLMGAAIVGAVTDLHKAKVIQKKMEYQRTSGRRSRLGTMIVSSCQCRRAFARSRTR